MRDLGVSNYPVYKHVVGNYLHQGPSYNKPDLNTYTLSQHVYTLGNYLHQGPSYNKPDLNTPWCK
jgi:hypothetical protein